MNPMRPRSASGRAPAVQPPLAATLAAAAEVVAGVLGGATPDAGLAALPPALRPGATDLALSALRAYGRGDAHLKQLLERPLKEAAAHGLLLVALQRLEVRPDEAHTIVDQAVGAAAGLAGGRLKGLVNAVLRGFERRREELIDAADSSETGRWRHPGWWIERVRHDHPQDWQAILAAGNDKPPMSLRVNPRRLAGADFLPTLAAAGIEVRELPGGALRLLRPVPVERVPGFADGLCSVQDAGAQYAASLLGAADGMRVLDACAAPGGKTAGLLERNDLDLLALDSDPQRAARVGANLARLGLQATVLAEDCRDPAKWWDRRPFDRILADVPCTASGVARRHPDAKWLRRAGDVAGFVRRQAEILDALWPTLAPGGLLLYVTCSVFAAENAGQVAAFLERHADARAAPLPGRPDTVGQWQLLPDDDHDGFFYALLQRV